MKEQREENLIIIISFICFKDIFRLHRSSNAGHDGMDAIMYITTHVSKTFELIEDARDVRANREIAGFSLVYIVQR